MINQPAMSQSFSSLKLECQRVMQIIMRNEASHDKQEMKQHNRCQIQYGSQVQINLEEQSKEFQLFYEDPLTGHNWINNLINQLSHDNEIAPSQFINLLIGNSSSTTHESLSKQDQRQQFTNRQHEYVFFNDFPSQSLLISSMQEIGDGCVLFVVRSFVGQIIYVSLNNGERSKGEVLERFNRMHHGRTLHVLIDSIDYSLGRKHKITERQLLGILKHCDIIYLLREIDHNVPQSSDNYVRYSIFYNSLLQKYTYLQQFATLQSSIPTLVQSLLQYFFTLMREQLRLIYDTFYNELTLITRVTQLNYNRKLQRQTNKNNELKDFILSDYYISRNMQDNSINPGLFHFAVSLPHPRYCYYCRVYKMGNKSTLYACARCQSEYHVVIPLCPECMEPFHQLKDKLKVKENLHILTSNIQKPEYHEKTSTQSCEKINMQTEQQKIAQKEPKLQVKRIKRITNLLGRKARQRKRISLMKKKKKLHLTSQQFANIKQLQQSGQRLISIFSEFKSLKHLYEPMIPKPINQIELKVELKNQFDFMKAMDVQLGREIEMFQGEVMMAMYLRRQLNEETENDSCEEFSRMVKIEHLQEDYAIKLPMVKIQQDSNESQQNESEQNIHNKVNHGYAVITNP